MSFLFDLDEDKLHEQLPLLFERAEKEITKSEPLFKLDGQRLEDLIRDLPKHQAHYSLQMQNMKHLMKWLENYKMKREAVVLKNLTRNNQRAFSATDQKTLIAGEKEIIETNQLIIESSLLAQQLEEITDSFKQMGWMLGHVTKLRVAELTDIIL